MDSPFTLDTQDKKIIFPYEIPQVTTEQRSEQNATINHLANLNFYSSVDGFTKLAEASKKIHTFKY